LNEIGDPDGGLGFVVAGAAAVEEAVFFVELEGIHGPVFALGFDDVGVGEEEEWFLFLVLRGGAVVADDEICFFVDGAADVDVGFGEACGFEASDGGFDDGSCGTGGVAGLDFDELFVDVVGELLFGGGAGGLGASCRGACD
jgi:hypothetical protein